MLHPGIGDQFNTRISFLEFSFQDPLEEPDIIRAFTEDKEPIHGSTIPMQMERTKEMEVMEARVQMEAMVEMEATVVQLMPDRIVM
jgi:hypothetical protein